MAKIRGARAEYYVAREELERVKRATETQTRSAWVKLSAAKRIAAARGFRNVRCQRFSCPKIGEGRHSARH